MANTLRLAMINCRGINNKLGEIKHLLYKNALDILCVSETKITRFEPKFVNYSTIWKHRDFRMGGGLGIIIHRNIQHQEMEIPPYRGGKLEYIAFKFFSVDGQAISLLSIYNPNERVTVQEFQYYIGQLGTTYVILGDFNAHTVKLDTNTPRTNFAGRSLDALLEQEDVCLINPVNFYTYLSPATGKKSCLDLCLS